MPPQLAEGGGEGTMRTGCNDGMGAVGSNAINIVDIVIVVVGVAIIIFII